MHLSNIELYFTSDELIDERVILTGDEFHHAVNVMRNSVGNLLHVTDGKGSIFTSQISRIKENELVAGIVEKREYENKANNVWLCIPILKNPDRLKFAFEKCVELGITNFILFSSKHTISKKANPDKFQKLTLAAMKQSLRAFLPEIISSSFSEIMKLNGTKILFDQNANQEFTGRIGPKESTYLLFGPEGGFDENETAVVGQENRFSLSSNRLRSETAIIKCASLLKLQ